jgi:hypothetical protein
LHRAVTLCYKPPWLIRRLFEGRMMFGSHSVRIGAGVALFLGSLLYLTLCMDQAVNVYDEGITLLGASVWVERAWTSIVSACSMVLIFPVADRVAPHHFALLAAILVGVIHQTLVFDQAGAMLRSSGVCACIKMLFRCDTDAAAVGAECTLPTALIWSGHPLYIADRNTKIFGASVGT